MRPAFPLPFVAGRGLRVIRADPNGVTASRGSEIFRSTDGGVSWKRTFHRAGHGWMRLHERFSLGRRLFRSDIVSITSAPDGSTVCIGRGAILKAPEGQDSLIPVFRVARGSRPLAIALADDILYWGEYFGNTGREEVYVYGSRDSGNTWYTAHMFPAGGIRHVHRIFFDEHRRRIWVLTGDEDAESMMLWTGDHFASLTPASQGSQLSRAVAAVPVPGGLVWGTDSPNGKNHIRLLHDNGRIEDLAELEGPSFYATRAGDFILISTAVEPSRVNVSYCATLVAARVSNLRDWRTVLRRRKDYWPMKLFQYGNIALPDGPGDGRYAWASGHSLLGADGMVWRWDLSTLHAFFDKTRPAPSHYRVPPPLT
jgi:hypothetical protein